MCCTVQYTVSIAKQVATIMATVPIIASNRVLILNTSNVGTKKPRPVRGRALVYAVSVT